MSNFATITWGTVNQTSPNVKSISKAMAPTNDLRLLLEAVSGVEVNVVIKGWQVVFEFPEVETPDYAEENRFWLAAADASFSFWDNDEDAFYDTL